MQQCVDKASGSGSGKTKEEEEEWAAKVVHFMDDKKVSELPLSPKCPSLIALYLQRNYELTAIPPLFFLRMSLLQVLDLSHTSIKSLPKSLPKLLALKKLLLRGCDLFMELAPNVGKLKNLEELDLDQTQIMDVPREIGKLIKLKILRVSLYPVCGKMKMKAGILIHPETISNLSQLSELSIDVSLADKRWEDSVEAVVKQVCNLKTLRTLNLYLPQFQLLDYIAPMYPSLSRFRFIVGLGHDKRRIISRVPQQVEAKFTSWYKCFKFVNGQSVPTAIKGVLRYSNSLFLDRHETALNLSEFGIENMKRLKFCLLAECNKMETVIDGDMLDQGNEDDKLISHPNSVQHVVLESLEHLSIYYMENLGSIWRGPIRYGCLSKLKFLALYTCPQLSNVFSLSLLEILVNLEELVLEDCPLVTTLVSDASVKPMMSYKFLPSLKRLLLLYLPQLISISSGLLIAPKLESIAFYNCPKLKTISKMELSSQTLRRIKGECQWWEDLKWKETKWGSPPEDLMHIFSPINNEEDVMTQITEDAEAMIQNEGHQLDDEKSLQGSTQAHKGEWSEYMEETLIATDLTESIHSSPDECSLSSEKSKMVEVKDDKINLASEFCEVDEDEDEPKAKRWDCTNNIEIKDLISCMKENTVARRIVRGKGVAIRTRNELLDDGYIWRKYGEKLIMGSQYPRRYYKCITLRCPAKKWVEPDTSDKSFSFVTYQGIHIHERRPYVNELNNCRSRVCHDHGADNMENAAEGAKAVIDVTKGLQDASVQDEGLHPEYPGFPEASIGDESQGSEDKSLVEVSRQAEGQQPDGKAETMRTSPSTMTMPTPSIFSCNYLTISPTPKPRPAKFSDPPPSNVSSSMSMATGEFAVPSLDQKSDSSNNQQSISQKDNKSTHVFHLPHPSPSTSTSAITQLSNMKVSTLSGGGKAGIGGPIVKKWKNAKPKVITLSNPGDFREMVQRMTGSRGAAKNDQKTYKEEVEEERGQGVVESGHFIPFPIGGPQT